MSTYIKMSASDQPLSIPQIEELTSGQISQEVRIAKLEARIEKLDFEKTNLLAALFIIGNTGEMSLWPDARYIREKIIEFGGMKEAKERFIKVLSDEEKELYAQCETESGSIQVNTNLDLISSGNLRNTMQNKDSINLYGNNYY